MTRWAASDWRFFLSLCVNYSPFILPVNIDSFCSSHIIFLFHSRHLCRSTPFLTSNTSTWEAWSVRPPHAYTLQIPRLGKRWASSSFILKEEIHVHLSNVLHCKQCAGGAGWLLCTCERADSLHLPCSEAERRQQKFLWKPSSSHRLSHASFHRWEIYMYV